MHGCLQVVSQALKYVCIPRPTQEIVLSGTQWPVLKVAFLS